MTSKTVIPFDWLKHAKTEEEKEAIVNLVTNNTAFIKLLLDILRDRYEALELSNYKRSSYSDGNNIGTLAFDNGQASAYLEISKLFTFKTKEGQGN